MIVASMTLCKRSTTFSFTQQPTLTFKAEVVTEPESVSNARTLEIECWEAPLPSRGDERSPQELLDDFAAVFDAGDES